jgi:hypothetical protein
MGDERLEELRARLDGIAEEIADLGHAKLREAIDTGSSKAVADERRLGRARRAVLKAAVLLGGGNDDEGT